MKIISDWLKKHNIPEKRIKQILIAYVGFEIISGIAMGLFAYLKIKSI
jgi:hypothetical protein